MKGSLLFVNVAKLMLDRVGQLRGGFRFGFEPQPDRIAEGDIWCWGDYIARTSLAMVPDVFVASSPTYC